MNIKLQQIKQQQTRMQRQRNVISSQLPPISPKNSAVNTNPNSMIIEAKRKQQIDKRGNTIKSKLIDIITEQAAGNSFDISKSDIFNKDSSLSINTFEFKEFEF
ncbi:Hypothetical_protein [Hexamita inflata]|uniref:Hypothetical_protein n=1 Tax=Hexamita inflata TaxID=28002 RepID=A0AA86NTY9_9EUKA|nr:Hypothetical protein HINF_LOCUS13058 [Hexamita inflata]